MKFKTGLVAEARNKIHEKEEQDRLHEKHDDVPVDVRIVEKSSAVRAVLNFLMTAVRVAATIAVATLAILGLLAVIYPEPRGELFRILREIYETILGYFG